MDKIRELLVGDNNSAKCRIDWSTVHCIRNLCEEDRRLLKAQKKTCADGGQFEVDGERRRRWG